MTAKIITNDSQVNEETNAHIVGLTPNKNDTLTVTWFDKDGKRHVITDATYVEVY